jgi:hypothetical protein
MEFDNQKFLHLRLYTDNYLYQPIQNLKELMIEKNIPYKFLWEDSGRGPSYLLILEEDFTFLGLIFDFSPIIRNDYNH